MIIRKQLYSNNKIPMKKTHDSAAPDTSVVRDVDTLLTPINHHQKVHEESTSKERTERNLWRNDEVMEMLYTMQQVKALEKLNDKTVKSENVFKDIEVIMHRNGFKKKSHVQIWTKWKFLKSTYMTSKRNGVIPRMIPSQIYETIHQMITSLNQSQADSSNSTNCSVDGDASNISGIVISGVEGGISDAPVTNVDDEDSLGMAHPIFGFRLGMVKTEPADTGYEAVENNGSDKDPLENESSSRCNKQVKDKLLNAEKKTNREPEPVQKVIEVPHRGRGRPPKNPPAASSTPINTLSPAAKNSQMPPLRVAPFAKTVNSANAIAANRPPPPLTMPPTPRIRIANLSDLKNADPVKFTQPKLMPKPPHQQQTPPLQSIRLPKEITLQTRTSSTPSPSYPKMKQIPMRKTPYSLRPDRAIPDLEASLSPSPPAVEKPSNKKFEEVPSTKHLVMQSNPNHMHNNGHRKRRSEWQDSLPTKQSKFNHNNQEDDVSKTDNVEDGRYYSRMLQNVIIDLSSSLRKMQTQMMRDFFNKQNELLEREHKFQLQQDRMIMRAFQEQTQEIMHSVKQLVTSIKTSKYEQQNERCRNLKEDKNNRRIRRRQKRMREHENEEEEDHARADNHEDDGQEEDQQMIQETEEVYTDNEEQHEENEQEEMENDGEEENEEEHEDNEQEEMENDGEEEDDNEQNTEDDQSQSTDNHDENRLTEEDDDSNDSDVPDHNHTHIVSNDLNRGG